MRLKY